MRHEFVEDTPVRTLDRHGKPLDLRRVEQTLKESRRAHAATLLEARGQR